MFIYLFVLVLMAQNSQAKFKVKVVSVHHCELPESQKDPDHPVQTNLTIRKISRDVTVLDCDLEVTSYGPVTFSFRSYQMLPNGHKSLILKFENVSCNNPLTSKMTALVNVKMGKDCMMAGGKFHFDSLDVNTFGFFLARSTTSPGKYNFQILFSSPKGIVECFEILSDMLAVKEKGR